MNRLKAMTLAAALVLAGVIFIPSAKSDQWDKKTILTISDPLEIPGHVLQPGKYTMKLMDSQSNRHIVQVFNEDGTQIITTILAIPNYRLQPTGKSEFGMWETPAGQPKALRSWFYPGDNFGQEFAYPKERATQIATVTRETVVAVPGPSVTEGEVEQVPPPPAVEEKREVAQAPPPPPVEEKREEAAPAPAPAPEPAPAAPAETLPQTASNLPLAALGGLFSLAAAAALRLISRRNS